MFTQTIIVNEVNRFVTTITFVISAVNMRFCSCAFKSNIKISCKQNSSSLQQCTYILVMTSLFHHYDLNSLYLFTDFQAKVKREANNNNAHMTTWFCCMPFVTLRISTLMQVKTFRDVFKREQMATPVLLERTSHYSFMVCVSLQLIV